MTLEPPLDRHLGTTGAQQPVHILDMIHGGLKCEKRSPGPRPSSPLHTVQHRSRNSRSPVQKDNGGGRG
ncbi:hypothetical protein EYF80_024496 [Liparis tanakae]|uniref:Uncharacterized protein n=1 Tax=Liparis tanakae TaxID=230148 RepID=A0A4Z2HID9_9TELE|nr:hypothetical protein EYF80_024496 [Liparis tanakae]